MVTTEQKSKARVFLSLHTNGELLVLPNIWNPIGARVLEAKGYPAVATASAAIAESLGYADGENIKLETMLDILFRISRSVSVPVTADIEAGYSDSLDSLKETISQVIQTGVVGINIEDSLVEGGSLRSAAEQCERIAAIREAASAQGLHLVINARVDGFLSDSFKSEKEKIEGTVTRARLYAEAGADCIYPIGPGDHKTLDMLRKRISTPLNVLASSKALGLTELHQLGINRVSFGPYIFRSCLSKFTDIADELKKFGEYDCFAERTLSRTDVGKFLVAGKE
ncbi:MAG: isocitrate lyase/phosphoenolpyruvate mutase family protein [Chloroflexi bacterium]|nr:isocitrate lyase/phosphoenolpyruvate mutase family protein [Chloroflexota bacterium]